MNRHTATEDDVNVIITRGSVFEGGKYRIYNHFQQEKTEKETVAFLKKEYGIGGFSWTFVDGGSGFVNFDGKGFSILYDFNEIEEQEPEISADEPEESTFVSQVMQDVDRLAAHEEPAEYDRTNYLAPYEPAITEGAKAKFAANVQAIRTLKEIEQRMASGGAPATEQEQDILAGYLGWGGLADAFDPGKDNWHTEYEQLKTLLTEDEYAAARESTLTAFYTPPAVIHAMYRALEHIGCVGGNVLEPSMGVGAFFGHRHSKFDTHNAKLYGVELDSLSGRIAQQLYQKAKIQITGYEKADLPDNFFDLAIGNVPFGQYQVGDRRYDKLHFQIHDYFLAKTVDAFVRHCIIQGVISGVVMVIGIPLCVLTNKITNYTKVR